MSLALSCIAAAWWGCSAAPPQEATGGSGTGGTSSSGGGGSAGSGGIGGDFDGGGGDDGGACTSISVVAERVRLDMIFLLDRSKSMKGAKWLGTTAALKAFFNDPKSAKIGAGLAYSPNDKDVEEPCHPEDYLELAVPVDVLPGNAFPLANSMPALALGATSPTFGALKGTLFAATAHQDMFPKRKVVVVLATDEAGSFCGPVGVDDLASLAKGARNYNGVETYVIAIEGADIPYLDQIAAAGGTQAAYDVTADIHEFSAKMEEIRGFALGCDFDIPPSPNGMDLDPDKVNFSYTPGGVGVPKVLLRTNDMGDCASDPGWYYDDNGAPTKIFLCPASCATVQADAAAEVNVLFGCKSQIK